jgi:hypothetical protein
VLFQSTSMTPRLLNAPAAAYRRKAMWSFPGIWDPATSNATIRKASSIILSFRNSTHHNALHAALPSY